MKKLIIPILLLFGSTLSSIAQCNDYYQIENGSEWEMETYNAKGKLSAKNHQKVSSYDKTASGFKAIIHSTMYNDKGKEMSAGDLEMSCQQGTILIDMRNFINQDQMKAFGNAEMKIEGDALEVPSKLSAGQALKDGTLILTAVGTPIPMTMTINITNRKVVSKESITTPAGTFDCYKITSTMNMQNKMGVTMNFTFSATDWIAPKVGMVKTESYDKNGKLNGYTILTKRK